MRLPADHRNSPVRRERDTRALSRLALLLFCGLVLAGGFVLAARQHFAAVKYGYNSENLRQEREQLLREQQQLMLAREQVSSPLRLELAARALGLRPLRANQVGATKPQAKSPSAAASAKSKTPATSRRH